MKTVDFVYQITVVNCEPNLSIRGVSTGPKPWSSYCRVLCFLILPPRSALNPSIQFTNDLIPLCRNIALSCGNDMNLTIPPQSEIDSCTFNPLLQPANEGVLRSSTGGLAPQSSSWDAITLGVTQITLPSPKHVGWKTRDRNKPFTT